MRPTYEHVVAYFRDTKRLIESNTTLRSLYDAMLAVQNSNMQEVDASPKQLRWMAENWSQNPMFVPIRLNELFNGLKVEHTDDYVLAMVGALGGRWDEEIRLFMLRHDHELRDTLFWRVFEVEGGGQISLANVDKFSREDLNWHNTVVLLTNEGTLDRSRVLRSCLEALNRDFSAYRAGWFSRVYEALAPTPDEAAGNQELLRLCLGSSVTATLSLGVKQLEMLHKVGLLEAAAFVDAAASGFSGPKAAAISLIKLLDALAAKNAVSKESAANALVLGLHHSHADVQRASIKALARIGMQELAYEQRDSVAPAVAAELLPLRGSTEASRDREPPVQVAAALLAEPLLAWTEADAFERYAALLEAADDALEFELAMAWLATAENAAGVLRSLAKRATALFSRDHDHYPAAMLLSSLAPEVEFLPRTYYQPREYVDGEIVNKGDPIPHPTVEESLVMPSFATRMRDVVAMVQGCAPRQVLLATPTDSHGWIELQTLLDRVKRLGGNAKLLPADREQALLRVRPEQRAQALAALGGEMPEISENVHLEWKSRNSDTLKANGSPQWVFWECVVRSDSGLKPSLTNPALIPYNPEERYGGPRYTTNLLTAAIGLATPVSTLLLTSRCIYLMIFAGTSDEVEHRAPAVLKALAKHPGQWSSDTVQLVAQGMATKQVELRALACELLAAAIPARLDASVAAEGFAACAPSIVLSRWADALADAASLAPMAVIDLLTHLLPRLEPKERGIGSLMNLLLDESLRHARPVRHAALRDWLGQFKGSSAAAKSAKALLALESKTPRE